MLNFDKYGKMNVLIVMLLIFLVWNLVKPTRETFTSSNNKKYVMSVVAIFKNEHEYMEEWLEHHVAQGFDHFYLYCNDPKKDNYPYFEKYKDKITLIDWVSAKNNGWFSIQKQAYLDCVSKYADNTQFLALLDLDEFMTPTSDDMTIRSYIESLKSKWDTIKTFKIRRYNIGSGGHLYKPDGSLRDNYKTKEKKCSSYKTMANTDYINKAISFGVHDFAYIKKTGKIYNDHFHYKLRTEYPTACDDNYENEIPIVINHYYFKSYEEYMQRCKTWKNGGVNPIGYRKQCTARFVVADPDKFKPTIKEISEIKEKIGFEEEK